MQNKKSLLQRLLVIYITFFIVLVASIAHGILPSFSRGAAEGAELGNDIAEKWKSGVPRMIYMLGDIRVTGQPETAVEIAAAPGVEIKANVRKLALVVEQNAPGTSPLGLAFRSIGGQRMALCAGPALPASLSGHHRTDVRDHPLAAPLDPAKSARSTNATSGICAQSAC